MAITLNIHGPSIHVNASVLGIRLLRWRPRPFISTAQIIGNRLKLRQLRRLRITADLVDLQMWLLRFIPFHVEQRKRKETTDTKNVLACGFRCLVSASRHHGLQHMQLVAITTELESQTAFIL